MDNVDILEQSLRAQQTKYYGKYRAFVVDNKDPEKRGRIKLLIPSVLGDEESDWALPCFAYGGAAGLGFAAVPPADAQVVAEFLEGDASSPMWTGTFWRTSSEPPAEFSGGEEPTAKVWKTDSGHLLVFEDQQDAETITLQSKAAAKLEMNPKGSFSVTDSGGAKVLLDAEAGEVHIEDSNGNSVVLSSSGIALKDSAGNEITTASSGITVKGSAITIDGNSIAIGGAGGEPLLKGQTFMSMFNAHTHACTAPGSPSGPPLPLLTPAALTTKTTAL